MSSQCLEKLSNWMSALAVVSLTGLILTVIAHLNLSTPMIEELPIASLLAGCLAWLLISAGLMSFIEHQVHRNLMHRHNFLSRRFASYKRTVDAHTIVHHKHYSKIFSDEPVAPGADKEIRLTVRKAPIKALPFALLIGLVSIPGAFMFIVVVTFHHWVWNQIHLEMHKPEGKFFSTWPIYRFLARHHYLHHLHQDKNFNVVFPFADYVLGTSVRATEVERTRMKELGLL